MGIGKAVRLKHSTAYEGFVGNRNLACPELPSRVKASRARVLLSFCCHHVVELAKAEALTVMGDLGLGSAVF